MSRVWLKKMRIRYFVYPVLGAESAMIDMKHQLKKSLPDYLSDIIHYSFPELAGQSYSISWKKIPSFAHVIIGQDGSFQIQCDNVTRSWAEPAMIGLLAHELCHVSLRNKRSGECETDECVIARGLGPYLAVERIYAGKYNDHIVQSGSDRYIGYSTIRKKLEKFELTQLDKLLSDLKLIPSETKKINRVHDSSLQQKGHLGSIIVDGIHYTTGEIPVSADVSIVLREEVIEIYVDDRLFQTLKR